MGLKPILYVLMFVVLAIPACGQETAEEWLYEGIALEERGKYDEAIHAFDEGIKLDPEDVDLWDCKAFALFGQDKYDEAIYAFDEAIRLDPEDGLAWFGKGFALLGQDKYDEAIHAFDKTIRLSSDLEILVMAWLGKWFLNGIILLEKSHLPISIVAMVLITAILLIGSRINRLRGNFKDTKMIRKVEAGIIIFVALAIWIYYLSRVLEDDWTKASIALFIAFMLGKSGYDRWKQSNMPLSVDEKGGGDL